jgi:hypothetical protein
MQTVKAILIGLILMAVALSVPAAQQIQGIPSNPLLSSVYLRSTLFAGLGATDGQVVYCSDCTAATNPCTGGGTGAFAFRQGGAWVCIDKAGGGGSVTVYTASLAFTDGDTLKRFTITNGSVTAGSQIVGTLRRPNVEDVDDHGWAYVLTVVKIGTGSFDVLVRVVPDEPLDSLYDPPNETLTFVYLIG